MKTSKLILLSLTILIFTSCEKNESVISSSNDINRSVAKNKTIQKSSANPLSSDLYSQAQLHNELLDVLGDTDGFLNNTSEENVQVILDWCNENNIEVGEAGDSDYIVYSGEKITDFTIADGYSADVVDQMTILEDIILTYFADTTYNYDNLENALISYENNIYSGSLTLTEKEYLIGASTFTRTSALFWEDALANENGNNPWNAAPVPSLDDMNFPSSYDTAIMSGNAVSNSSLSIPFFITYTLLCDLSGYLAGGGGDEGYIIGAFCSANGHLLPM